MSDQIIFAPFLANGIGLHNMYVKNNDFVIFFNLIIEVSFQCRCCNLQLRRLDYLCILQFFQIIEDIFPVKDHMLNYFSKIQFSRIFVRSSAPINFHKLHSFNNPLSKVIVTPLKDGSYFQSNFTNNPISSG